MVPLFISSAKLLRKLFGRAGARLVPIVEFSHLGLSHQLNKEWAILDTFDMYSPAHDHPQSMKKVKSLIYRRMLVPSLHHDSTSAVAPSHVAASSCKITHIKDFSSSETAATH